MVLRVHAPMEDSLLSTRVQDLSSKTLHNRARLEKWAQAHLKHSRNHLIHKTRSLGRPLGDQEQGSLPSNAQRCQAKSSERLDKNDRAHFREIHDKLEYQDAHPNRPTVDRRLHYSLLKR